MIQLENTEEIVLPNGFICTTKSRLRRAAVLYNDYIYIYICYSSVNRYPANLEGKFRANFGEKRQQSVAVPKQRRGDAAHSKPKEIRGGGGGGGGR